MPDDDANDFFGTSGLIPRRERVGRRPREAAVPAADDGHFEDASAGRWRHKDTPVDEPPPPPPPAGRPASEVEAPDDAAPPKRSAQPAAAAKPASAARVRAPSAKPALPAAAKPGSAARARAPAPLPPSQPTRPRAVPPRPAAAAAASSSAVEPTLLDLSMRELRAVPPSVTSHHSLLELNLSFNSLTSIDALPRACPLLQRLSVAHNTLAALPSLASLTSLRRLDVSSNRLRSLDGAAGCPELVELLAASNCLRLDAMAPLRQTASLRHLVMRSNPAEKVLPAGIYRHTAALLLRQLATLDASPLDVAAARAFAKADDARRAISDTLGHKIALVALKADAPVEAASRRREAVPRRRRGGGGGPPADASAGRWRHKDDPRPAACASFDAPPGYDDLSVRMGGANGGGLQPSLSASSLRSSTSDLGASAAAWAAAATAVVSPSKASLASNSPAKSPSARATTRRRNEKYLGDYLGSGGSGGGGSGGRRGSGDFKPDAPWTGPFDQSPVKLDYLGRRGPASKGPNGANGFNRGLDGMYRPADPASPSFGGAAEAGLAPSSSASTLPPGAQGQPRDLAASLEEARRRLEESEAGLRHSLQEVEADVEARRAAHAYVVPIPKKGKGRPGKFGEPLSSSAASVPSAAEDFEIRYPRGARQSVAAPSGGGGGVAVRVRADGSAVAKWGGGGVAVLVEKAKAGTTNGYSMVAYYRKGSLAVSFDASGVGSVNAPDGTLRLRHDATRGGVHFGADGAVLQKWPAPPAPPVPGIASVDDPGVPPAAPAAAPGDGDDDDFSALAAKARLAHGGGGGGDTPASRGSPTSDFSWVELRLDSSLSCRFCPATGELRVPFCTGGVRYEFRRAPNAQRPVWDASDPFLRGVADLADAGSPSARRPKPLPALPPGVSGISGIGDVLDSMLPDLSQLSYGGGAARARGAPSTQRLVETMVIR